MHVWVELAIGLDLGEALPLERGRELTVHQPHALLELELLVLLRRLERTLKDNRDKLDEADASTIEGRVMELRGVLESSDVNEIRQKTEALQEAAQKLAEAVYAQASAQEQASAPADGDGTAASDDEVIEDAEIVDEEGAKTS